MSTFRLLVVEDAEEDLRACRATLVRYKDERQRDIELIECTNVNDALLILDNSFDGAIIDMNLSVDGNEGNQVIDRIINSNLRIPVAILTGTPDATDTTFSYIGVFIKGAPGAGYADLLDIFWGIHNTGLTRIMGGRGIIEENLNKVFSQNLLPQKGIWVSYGESDSARTEKALLRHTLSHLLQLLDGDGDRCFPEEVYLSPPLTGKIRTGSIVKKKAEPREFIIMNPACDLAIRDDGGFKTDRILLAEIEDGSDVVNHALNGIQKADKQKTKLKAVYGNNHTGYYHWLPATTFFNGGFVNFRKLSSLTHEEFGESFEVPSIQISPFFVKDIVSRFSSFYARQGQPDIEFNDLITNHTTKPENSQ